MPTASTRTAAVIAFSAIMAFAAMPALSAYAESYKHNPGAHAAMKAGGASHKGGMMGGGHGSKHGKGHQLKPHNAAVHFLKMADKLNLDDAQLSQLRLKRNAYTEAHAVHTAQLKAAQADLKRALHAEFIDLNHTKALLSTTGKLEAILWPAFVEQLHDIKAMLSDAQRKRLKGMHSRGHK
jgi:hypothetical protein